jgi:hypothetical protein
MKVCFTSYRPFSDGPVEKPFLESDPANIAYALGGDYVSFYSLRKLSDRQLADRFRSYDIVIVALDVEAIDLVQRIVETCPGRVATYSEGHVGDYQRLSPAGQVSFLTAIRTATFNLLYWERYVPFYRSLTSKPVEYLPYPYLLDEARRHFIPPDQRPLRIAVPTGLAGYTRNGLASLTVAKHLLDEGVAQDVVCWLDPETFAEDGRAVEYVLHSTPFAKSTRANRVNWRKWLSSSRIDYRLLLKLKAKLDRPQPSQSQPAAFMTGNLILYRRTGWPNYLSQLAPARIMIDLNNRETVGRNALDCAALGVPCVSTDRSDLQSKIFRETTLVDPWSIDAAVQACRRLLGEGAFYQDVVAQASSALEQYDCDAFKRRFRTIIGMPLRSA